MPLDTILSRLKSLLPELLEAENFALARSVREVIALIQSEQDEAAAQAADARDAA